MVRRERRRMRRAFAKRWGIEDEGYMILSLQYIPVGQGDKRSDE